MWSSNDIQITSCPSPALANAIVVRSDGGLSDSDEMRGAEREAAVNSPPKGKKVIVSDVSPCFNTHFILYKYSHL